MRISDSPQRRGVRRVRREEGFYHEVHEGGDSSPHRRLSACPHRQAEYAEFGEENEGHDEFGASVTCFQVATRLRFS